MLHSGNINKARESVAKKFLNGSTEQLLLQNVCYDEYANVSSQAYANKLSSEWSIFKQFLINISQPCHEMLILCQFALETFPCMDLFDTVLSDEGISLLKWLKLTAFTKKIFVSGLCCIYNSVSTEYLYKNSMRLVRIQISDIYIYIYKSKAFTSNFRSKNEFDDDNDPDNVGM